MTPQGPAARPRWLTAAPGDDDAGGAPSDAAPSAPPPIASTEYRPLFKYLDERFADAVVLTFAQIEDLLGRQLPDPALHQPGWWADADASGALTVQSRCWHQAGRTATANLSARIVRFERVAGPPGK